jgi:hypothetical protein
MCEPSFDDVPLVQLALLAQQLFIVQTLWLRSPNTCYLSFGL